MEVPAARIAFSDADRAEVAQASSVLLQSGSLTLGEHTRRLEEEFARLHDAPYAVAVSSGTAALEIVLRTVDVRGCDVIVPANTFVATALAVMRAGGHTVLADADPTTLSVSRATVEAALTPRCKAVVVVHIGGLISPEMGPIQELCDQRGLALVEDAAHAHGSTLGGRCAGSFGVAAAFSFYPTKVITSGEGGMIVTGDPRVRDEAIVYRDQG
ncbi:MAG: DegT/DnrJ/EryC1/StrS family aminotransferase, partial [Acidimicrobiales bacterium]